VFEVIHRPTGLSILLR